MAADGVPWPSDKVFASRAANLASIPVFFFGSSHTSDLKMGAPVAALPSALRYRFNAGTGRSGVSILFCLCVFFLISGKRYSFLNLQSSVK